MRLHLTILRHGLPATRILWTVRSQTSHAVPTSAITSTRLPNAAYGNEGCTIAQLLEDINEVVPLETTSVEPAGENEDLGGQWGLEDYVVEVNGFECLHFMSVDGLLREGDEVVIRSLDVGDIRARRLSGRVQVSTDGRRLIDGVPFGRPYLQRPYSSRPPIRIPPRKRRRTTLSSWTGNLEVRDGDTDETDTRLALYHDESVLDSEHGTVIRHPKLFEDGDDDEDDDMDYEEDTEELAEELKSLRDEANADIPFFATPDFKRFRAGRMSRMAHRDPLPSSSPARPSVVLTPRTNLTRGVDGEASVKSTKSVHFEADISNFESQLAESDSESDENVVSEESSAASSDSDDSSAESSDEEFSAEESDIDSSGDSSVSEESEPESDSESQSEDEELPRKRNSKAIDVFTPPGEGNRKTRNSNRRKKLRSRLEKLKSLGELPPEANFDDLKNWQARNGKAPLMEVTGLKREARSKEQSEMEIKRQQLLRDLASGGVDVDGHSEKENIPPRYRNGKQQADVQESAQKSNGSPATTITLEATVETPAADEQAKPSPTEIKKRKLDLSSTKRLLFGSLGVRAPKTKEDEEALRTKLDSSRTKPAPEKVAEAETAEKKIEEEEADENWQQKIVLSATECLYDDIELAAPPFPFQQRWDSDANHAIRQQKNNNNKKNKKRKQRDWQEEEAYESYQDTALNYDDPPTTTEKETTAQKEEQVIDVNSDDVDLPSLPSDIAAFPVIMNDNEVTVGSIIAFKHLLMSKATNWQPQISDYKVAKVGKIYDNDTLDMVLAKRDREVSEKTETDENGVRQYAGFEMPDDDHEVEDDGFRSVAFADLIEPKMIKAAVVKDSDQSQKADASANGNDQTSLLNHPPTPSVPVISSGSNAAFVDTAEDHDEADDELPPHHAAAVSSQTRLEISHMIHDAGFRSAIDPELGKEQVLLETLDDKPREDSAIEMQSEAAKIASANDKGSGSTSEEFASSPPDVGDQHGDMAEESQVVDQGDNMAIDMDDAGFQMDVDDDFVMNDQSGSQAGDDSDDGVSLPPNDTAKSRNNELATNERVSSVAGKKSQPSQQTPSQIVKQEQGQNVESGQGEAQKSFLSTTVRANTRSFTEPAVLDNGSYDDDDDDDDAHSEYSDAYSTVPNPFYERDAAATRNEKVKATDEGPASAQQDPPSAVSSRSRQGDHLPSSNMPKSNQEANKVTDYTPESAEMKDINNKLNFDLGFLDDNREESEDSDVDFPDIEVLWASTAPTQKEFTPIKMESEAASQMPKLTADREVSSPVRQPSTNVSSAAEPVSTATKDTSAAVNEKQPEPSQQQAVSEPSSKRDNQEPEDHNNEDERPKTPSPFLPDLDFAEDTNNNADIDLNDTTYNGIDEDDQYQHSADNSSHPDFQPQEQQEESQDHSIPIVDLTVSSPLVSPDDSDDEDFAKSQGLPRGPGWAKKNVPSTWRQTRSSTGGGIVLSSSLSPPPTRRRGGRLTQSQF